MMTGQHLSPRQEEIVRLVVAYRMSYREVGEALGISHHTVRSHVEVIGYRLRDLDTCPRKAMAAHYRAKMLER